MSGLQDGDAGRLVYAARFHTDKAVLDQIDAADAVFAADIIEFREQIDRTVFFAVDRDRLAFFERQRDLLGRVRCVFQAISSAGRCSPAVRPTGLRECRLRS